VYDITLNIKNCLRN